MSKTTKELVVIVVGCLIFVIILVSNLKKARGPSRGKAAEKPTMENVNLKDTDRGAGIVKLNLIPKYTPELGPGYKEDILRQGAKLFEGEWGRDPFILSLTPIQRVGSLELTGISWKDGKAIAIISDYIVREGDLIQGSQILEIGKNNVVIKKGGRKYILRLEK